MTRRGKGYRHRASLVRISNILPLSMFGTVHGCSNIYFTCESSKVWYSVFKLIPEPAEFPF
jgi:hypothetical protein